MAPIIDFVYKEKSGRRFTLIVMIKLCLDPKEVTCL